MNYKIITYVPIDHANKVRMAMGEVGAGKIGDYSHCSFSVRGVGRFKPEQGAQPVVGTIGQLEEVEEERIEMVCSGEKIGEVLAAMKKAHPYEEVAYEVYKMEDL